MENMVNEMEIIIPRSAEFHRKAQELSEFVHGLNLSHEQNNELVRLMQEMTETAEKSGFAGGIQFCTSFEKGEN